MIHLMQSVSDMFPAVLPLSIQGKTEAATVLGNIAGNVQSAIIRAIIQGSIE